MYMKTRNYMDKWHIAGYVAAGGLLALGLVMSLLAYFASGEITAGIASLIVFLLAPVCAFVFLGLTQETGRNKPMNWKRALIYAADTGLILFGVIVFAVTFFTANDLQRALESTGSLIPFVLPGAVVLAFLLLTEKSRHKPWVVEQETAWAEQLREQFADPYAATRFGLFSGALWILAIALFVALGFMIGFRYSWLIFLVAVAAEMLIQALMTPKNKKHH
jgi:hypothetical protein